MKQPSDGELMEFAAGTEAGVVAELQRQVGHGEEVDVTDAPVRVAAGPDGVIRTYDFEYAADNPRRYRGSAKFFDVDSFHRYVEAQTTKDAPARVYANPADRKIVAVLDDDGTFPGWREQRAELVLRETEPWQRWTKPGNPPHTAGNGVLASQEAFAEHIKDSLIDITDPDGARIYEIAESLEATNKVDFKSHQRLHSGEVKFAYEETQQARAGHKGELEIPKQFTLGIAPWIGLDPVEIHADLRWRIGPGGLLLGYKLLELEQVLEFAFASLVDELRGKGLELFSGIPAGPVPPAPRTSA